MMTRPRGAPANWIPEVSEVSNLHHEGPGMYRRLQNEDGSVQTDFTQVIALHDYEANNEREISFKKDDVSWL